MAGSRRGFPDGIFYGGALAFLVLMIYVWLIDVAIIDGYKILLGGALLIGTVAAVVSVAWHLLNRPTTPTALELSRRFEAVHSMDGAQFEFFVAALFRAMGHRAVVLGGAGD